MSNEKIIIGKSVTFPENEIEYNDSGVFSRSVKADVEYEIMSKQSLGWIYLRAKYEYSKIFVQESDILWALSQKASRKDKVEQLISGLGIENPSGITDQICDLLATPKLSYK